MKFKGKIKELNDIIISDQVMVVMFHVDMKIKIWI